MENRRNLYRLLHVQRDAPAEIIKSSYRTLMQTLRQHPDLGGDEWNAQLLNEARSTLCDPQARAHYDAISTNAAGARAAAGTQRADEPGARRTSGSSPEDAACTSPEPPAVQPGAGAEADHDAQHCHYCQSSLPDTPLKATGYAPCDRCRRCGAPTRLVHSIPGRQGAHERRALHRMVGDADATIARHWPLNETTRATLLEFSTAGCAFESDVAFQAEDVVLLRTAVLTATGTVRCCDPVRGSDAQRVGVAFLSVAMHTAAGQIFSASV